MDNLLFNLPENCIKNIYEFDRTYHEIFQFCLIEMMINFQECAEMNRLLRKAIKRKYFFFEFANFRIQDILN
tara:strand:- start:269 stop:484 length:216 start_codon:yes stop_codon:yes gene_type:complete